MAITSSTPTRAVLRPHCQQVSLLLLRTPTITANTTIRQTACTKKRTAQTASFKRNRRRPLNDEVGLTIGGLGHGHLCAALAPTRVFGWRTVALHLMADAIEVACIVVHLSNYEVSKNSIQILVAYHRIVPKELRAGMMSNQLRWLWCSHSVSCNLCGQLQHRRRCFWDHCCRWAASGAARGSPMRC